MGEGESERYLLIRERGRKRVNATNGEMIDQIQEWINTGGEILSDEEVIENIRELLNGGGL